MQLYLWQQFGVSGQAAWPGLHLYCNRLCG